MRCWTPGSERKAGMGEAVARVVEAPAGLAWLPALQAEEPREEGWAEAGVAERAMEEMAQGTLAKAEVESWGLAIQVRVAAAATGRVKMATAVAVEMDQAPRAKAASVEQGVWAEAPVAWEAVRAASRRVPGWSSCPQANRSHTDRCRRMASRHPCRCLRRWPTRHSLPRRSSHHRSPRCRVNPRRSSPHATMRTAANLALATPDANSAAVMAVEAMAGVTVAMLELTRRLSMQTEVASAQGCNGQRRKKECSRAHDTTSFHHQAESRLSLEAASLRAQPSFGQARHVYAQPSTHI